MNELIIQPFFWGDTVAVLNALLLFSVALGIFYIRYKCQIVDIECGWLFGLSLLLNALYVIFIYMSLYGEVIAQWLSTIF